MAPCALLRTGPFHTHTAMVRSHSVWPYHDHTTHADERPTVSRLQARHEKRGEPAVLVSTPVLFTLSEAARALALVYGGRQRALTGINSLQTGLAHAAANRVLEKRRKPDEQLVAHYRDALIDAGVFTEQ